jgi:flagellar biosynthesis chaperone FliJ
MMSSNDARKLQLETARDSVIGSILTVSAKTDDGALKSSELSTLLDILRTQIQKRLETTEALSAAASKREESYIKTLGHVCAEQAKLLEERLPAISCEDPADEPEPLIECLLGQLQRLRDRLRADADARRDGAVKLEQLQKEFANARQSIATILEVPMDPEQPPSTQIVVMATEHRAQVDRRITELTTELEAKQSTLSAIDLRMKGIFGVNSKVISVFQGLDLLQDQHEKIQKENEALKEARLMFRHCLMGLDPELKETDDSQITDQRLVSRIQQRFDPDHFILR